MTLSTPSPAQDSQPLTRAERRVPVGYFQFLSNSQDIDTQSTTSSSTSPSLKQSNLVPRALETPHEAPASLQARFARTKLEVSYSAADVLASAPIFLLGSKIAYGHDYLFSTGGAFNIEIYQLPKGTMAIAYDLAISLYPEQEPGFKQRIEAALSKKDVKNALKFMTRNQPSSTSLMQEEKTGKTEVDLRRSISNNAKNCVGESKEYYTRIRNIHQLATATLNGRKARDLDETTISSMPPALNADTKVANWLGLGAEDSGSSDVCGSSNVEEEKFTYKFLDSYHRNGMFPITSIGHACYLVDTKEELINFHVALSKHDACTLFFRGMNTLNASNESSLSLMAIYHKPTDVSYVFDIITLGDAVFETQYGGFSLRQLLEMKEIEKVFYGVGAASSSLYKFSKIKIRGAIDVQQMESPLSGKIRNYDEIIDECKAAKLLDWKDVIHLKYVQSKVMKDCGERPLRGVVKEYMGCNARTMAAVYDLLDGQMTKEMKNKAMCASQALTAKIWKH